jgi:transposase InsO family protein
MGLQMSTKKELLQRARERYQAAATKKEKSRILDDFVENTGYDRKYALKLLNAKAVRGILIISGGKAVKLKPVRQQRKGRTGKKVYGDQVIASLRLIWEFFWYKCGKILAPFMRQQMPFIADWPAFRITPEIREKLMNISPATIDRALKKTKESMRLKGKRCTKNSKKLKNLFPIRTFYTSGERKTPGFLQTDTVHHCGASTAGEYLLSLTATDVFSGWIEPRALLNKAWSWTFDALADVRSSLPFPFLEYHSDNGGEFINESVAAWCRREQVAFTVSRAYKKNDNCFAEQSNDKCVRTYIGYDRLVSPLERDLLADVYRSLAPLLNFFMPAMKLLSKVRIGSREIKKYDEPASPYQRLIASPCLSPDVKDKLTAAFRLYNPVALQHDVNIAIAKLHESTDRRLAGQAAKVNRVSQ